MKNNTTVTIKQLVDYFKISPSKIIYLLKGAKVTRKYEIVDGRSVCHYNRKKAFEVLNSETKLGN